ncbi:transmembrane protein, putative (macronuclear) [Tetrahymena thermophila SB210]|uniref:Transmembrane protein, putative n=1 Tax=Tetrahymena thermophila (strain SB210) TaxID=312017 RepID=Q23KH3_TETTS|nr:transmembrane protein, putative [Tetrahymena thermophila SB210]EAR96870.1 transmembrane protein, putative [Tetrahymena thermophila SB210]|eukprot:XP_001017115.1 transmembrane protein, putative [Tetrahymena thermophila SB210]
MKSVTPLLALFLVLSLINVQVLSAPTPPQIPTFITNQTNGQNFETCMTNLSTSNPNPCSSSSNANCSTILGTFSTCWNGCYSQTSFSTFQTCTNGCSDTATGSSGDSSLSSFISSMKTCVSKLSSPSLYVSFYVFALFVVVFIL